MPWNLDRQKWPGYPPEPQRPLRSQREGYPYSLMDQWRPSYFPIQNTSTGTWRPSDWPRKRPPNWPFGTGLGQGFGGGAPSPTPPAPKDWTAEKWFPELYNLIYGRLQGGQRNMLNQMTGNLGRTMGAHLSRTNVAVPTGADTLARRYLSPLMQAMEMQDPMTRMSQAMGMARQFAPMFGETWGQESPLYQRITDPAGHLKKFMGRFWGGGA